MVTHTSQYGFPFGTSSLFGRNLMPFIKSDPTDGHGGFGAGALSLDNISPVFVDVEEKEGRW
jgi:hypothetical protein